MRTAELDTKPAPNAFWATMDARMRNEAALWQMKEIHDPRTVGIAEWVEDLEDCLSDLEADVFDEDYE